MSFKSVLKSLLCKEILFGKRCQAYIKEWVSEMLLSPLTPCTLGDYHAGHSYIGSVLGINIYGRKKKKAELGRRICSVMKSPTKSLAHATECFAAKMAFRVIAT